MQTQESINLEKRNTMRTLAPLKFTIEQKMQTRLKFQKLKEEVVNAQLQGLSTSFIVNKNDLAALTNNDNQNEDDEDELAKSKIIFSSSAGPKLMNTFPLIKKDLYDDYDVDRPPRWIRFHQNDLAEQFKNNSISVLCYTWNMFGKNPSKDIEEFLGPTDFLHHIVAIGSEECLRSIGKSVIYSNKKAWEKTISQILGSEYVKLSSHTLNAIHLIIFAHISIMEYITSKQKYENVYEQKSENKLNNQDIDSDDVSTGIGNFIGNKGAVGISFILKGNKFLFVNCHLESGQNAVSKRNTNFNRIEKEMNLPKSYPIENPKSKLSDKFDFVFWSGDFNYRINMTRQVALKLINDKKYDVIIPFRSLFFQFQLLLQNDQLQIQKELNGLAKNFDEGPLKFPPTYKYDINTTYYDRSKKGRTPGWTDRIMQYMVKYIYIAISDFSLLIFLFQKKRYKYKKNEESDVKVISYDCINNIMISDHRPVFCQFQVKLNNITPEVITISQKIAHQSCIFNAKKCQIW